MGIISGSVSFWGRFGDHFGGCTVNIDEGFSKGIEVGTCPALHRMAVTNGNAQKFGGGGSQACSWRNFFNTEALLKMQFWGHFGHQLQLPQNFYTPHSVNMFRNFYQRNKLVKKIALSTTYGSCWSMKIRWCSV